MVALDWHFHGRHVRRHAVFPPSWTCSMFLYLPFIWKPSWGVTWHVAAHFHCSNQTRCQDQILKHFITKWTLARKVTAWIVCFYTLFLVWLPGAEWFSPFLGSLPHPGVSSLEEGVQLEINPPLLKFHCGVMNSATGDPWQADGHSPLTPTSTPSTAWTCHLSLRKCCVHSAGFISAQQNWGSESWG